MIGLAPLTFDADGDLLLREVPGTLQPGEVTRRVTRRPTLDGGATFEDRGSYDADRQISFRVRPTRELRDTLERLVTTYRWLLVVIPDGVFVAAPQRADLRGSEFRLNLLVKERRSN